MQCRVLVVDDDAAFRELASALVRDLGLDVAGEAATYAEGAAAADDLRPDAALVDVGLPDGDGFSLARQLRVKPWTMRVVVFSSDADPSNEAAAARAGAIGFFPKDELLSPALQRLIEDKADDDR